MTVHTLKCWPAFFRDLGAGDKTAEFRRNDRDYREGDFLVLKEWDPDTRLYTGRWIQRRVASVSPLDGVGAPGFVLMEIRP